MGKQENNSPEGEQASAAVARPRSDKADSSSEEGKLRRFRVGHILNSKFRLEQMIAKGGMGAVYLGTQLPLGRKVAVKILVPQSNDREFHKRFLLEASICSRLTHRHIVTIHDYGETEEGDLFTAMEFLDGEPLSRTIAREVRLTPERATRITAQIARALRAAHRAGVVHRDLKPSNVMLLQDDEDDGSDFVKVLDFGLVKVYEKASGPSVANAYDELDLTRAGTMLGSPRYMAPEQISGKPVDPRTDIYSLGVMLFHMLAGRPPFVGKTSVEILNQHLYSTPPAISQIVPETHAPLEIEEIARRCMAKRPSERYESMDEVLAELKAAYRLISDESIVGKAAMRAFAETKYLLESKASEPVAPAANPSLKAFLTGEFQTDGIDGSSDRSKPSEVISQNISYSENYSRSQPPLRDDKGSSIWKFMALAISVVLATVLLLIGTGTIDLSSNSRLGPIAPDTTGIVRVALTSEPQKAQVYMANQFLGQTPLEFELPRMQTEEQRKFTFKLVGYEDTTLQSRLDHTHVTLHARLRKVSEEAIEPSAENTTNKDKTNSLKTQQELEAEAEARLRRKLARMRKKMKEELEREKLEEELRRRRKQRERLEQESQSTKPSNNQGTSTPRSDKEEIPIVD